MLRQKYHLIDLLVTLVALLLFEGCEAPRQSGVYNYSAPVVVTFMNLQHTNNSAVAFFMMKNVSDTPMWYSGEEREHPACCVEYKSMPLSSHSAGGSLWGDTGLTRYKLGPGQSVVFGINRSEFSEPFRGGVWLSPELVNKTTIDLIYWSEFVSP